MNLPIVKMRKNMFFNNLLKLFSFINIYFFIPVASLDSGENWQIGFQDPATPIMQGIVELYDDIFFFLIVVICTVFWLLFRLIWNFNSHANKLIVKEIKYGEIIEVVWTIVPAILLLFVAVPSFTLLYSMDELIDPMLSVKVIGHQWYWSYEYSDYTSSNLEEDSSFIFDSYMINEEDLDFGQLRLLEVDRRVVLPTHTHVRVVITSSDVIHSWAVPSLGLKIDACPGRLNQTSLFIDRPGVYYGQCSEICGINHGFMPIVIEAVSFKDYSSWIFVKYMEENLVNEDGEIVELINSKFKNMISVGNEISLNKEEDSLFFSFVKNLSNSNECSSFYNRILKFLRS